MLAPLQNNSFLYGILSINLLQDLMNSWAILAQFQKKLDVNPLFKLLIHLHFDNARKGFHKILMHEVWPSPREIDLLLNVNWLLWSVENWWVAPPVHNPLLRLPTARTFWTDNIYSSLNNTATTVHMFSALQTQC